MGFPTEFYSESDPRRKAYYHWRERQKENLLESQKDNTKAATPRSEPPNVLRVSLTTGSGSTCDMALTITTTSRQGKE